MEDAGIVSELNLDGATEVASRSSYQTFLQQLNADHNATGLYPNDNSQHIGIKDTGVSSVHVYQKTPPPYTESHYQQQQSISEVDIVRKSVDELIESKLLPKPRSSIEKPVPETFQNDEEFNDRLICK